MGVLQRFERRLEGMVEGAFARVFGGHVQPVEIAAALAREAEGRKAIVARGRVLVPNEYVVELGSEDAERLAPYDEALKRELALTVSEHADERGWSFVGPVVVSFERVDDLATGVFRLRSAVHAHDVRGVPDAGLLPSGPRLVLPPPPGGGEERVVPITGSLVIGRGADADLQLVDTGASRRHAELVVGGDGRVELVDLQSTNGTGVNGERVLRRHLQDGDTVTIGGSTHVFRAGMGDEAAAR